MRGGDDAHIDGNALRAAEPVDLTFLEHAQQLDLHFWRQVADLVEEDGRVVRQFEPPDLARDGAGERAFLAPEQLALDERGRNRGAVHAHHRPAASRAPVVDLRCEDLFSRAGFPGQEHR